MVQDLQTMVAGQRGEMSKCKGSNRLATQGYAGKGIRLVCPVCAAWVATPDYTARLPIHRIPPRQAPLFDLT